MDDGLDGPQPVSWSAGRVHQLTGQLGNRRVHQLGRPEPRFPLDLVGSTTVDAVIADVSARLLRPSA